VAGFVYVMTNPAFPHLVKIGKSAKDPRQDRVNELNHTGVPQPFCVEYYAFVEDEGTLERWLHGFFEERRPNKSREFFQIEVVDAINAVRDAAKLGGGIKYEEIFYVSPAELEARRKKDEEERKKVERFNAIRKAEAVAKRERDRLLAKEQERVAAEERQRRELARQEDEKRINALGRKRSINGFLSVLILLTGMISLLVATAFPIFWVPALGCLLYGMYLSDKSF
jgi:hypothetical protein